MATTEYLRYHFFNPKTALTPYVTYRLGLSFSREGEFSKASRYLKRALRQTKSKHAKAFVRYGYAMVLIAANKVNLAHIHLLKLHRDDTPPEVAEAALVLSLLLSTMQENWRGAHATVSRLEERWRQHSQRLEKVRAIKSILHDLQTTTPKKSPNRARKLSTFLPGLGQFYAGAFKAGVNALALNALNSYFVGSRIQQKKYGDALLFASVIWWRYYKGNKVHAEEEALRTNQRPVLTLQKNLYVEFEQLKDWLPEESLVLNREDFFE